mmetsp:Transcript_6379/g.15788  ORF Transcript_6379/g.15788 Transcript_6379/m.15788 type:complete len:219 (-) Transcript_6379:182-838(-)
MPNPGKCGTPGVPLGPRGVARTDVVDKESLELGACGVDVLLPDVLAVSLERRRASAFVRLDVKRQPHRTRVLFRGSQGEPHQQVRVGTAVGVVALQARQGRAAPPGKHHAVDAHGGDFLEVGCHRLRVPGGVETAARPVGTVSTVVCRVVDGFGKFFVGRRVPVGQRLVVPVHPLSVVNGVAIPEVVGYVHAAKKHRRNHLPGARYWRRTAEFSSAAC